MGEKSGFEPRKQPRQRRAQATVEAILEATTQVLVKEGYNKTTTNRIAKVAGVSIGTLYQYFPNKEALVVALSKRHSESSIAMLSGMIQELVAAPPRVAARALIKAMLDVHAVDPKLHKVLVEHLPQQEIFQQHREMTGRARDMVRAYLEVHKDAIVPEDLDLAAFLVVTTVETTTHAAVIYHPELLGSDELVDQITRLVYQYLFGLDPAQDSP